MTFLKTKLVLAIVTATFTFASAMVSPEAMAVSKSKAKKVKVKKVKKAKRSSVSSSVVETGPSVDNSASSTSSATAALQAQVNELSAQVNALKNQPAPVVSAPEVRTVKDTNKDNMVFFRGGYARSNRHRPGVSILSGVAPVGAQDTADKDAWYFGAGLDFSLDDNLFGMMDKTEVLAEVMFEYKEFSDTVQGNALANTPTQLAGGALNPRAITVNQFTLAASPKIKFMKGSAFRPWIIPVGFKMDVVSPPTESITVLNPGMMFGLGADYNLWKNIYVGVDARWHQSLGRRDGVDTNGLTAGGYLGLGF